MDHTTDFLLRHGYALLFAWVFTEQVGVPIPALPLLVATGASAGKGELSFALLLAATVLPAALSDSLWYWIGSRKGGKVLSFLCRISLEPDSCVRSTQALFTRRGPKSLLVAKFIPGLGTVSMPLAGIVGMPYPTFLAYGLTGTLLWALTFLGAGYLFSAQLDLLLGYLHSGGLLLLTLLLVVAGWIAFKYWQRHRFLKKLRVARIAPSALKEYMDQGQEVMIVDLRSQIAVDAHPVRIPGALQIRPEELGKRHIEIPRDREIILYCT